MRRSIVGLLSPKSRSAPSHNEESTSCAIKVIIRARPLNEREILGRSPMVVSVQKNSLQIINPTLFLDPTFQAATQPKSRPSDSGPPLALTAQALAAATAAGECRTFYFDRCYGMDAAYADGDNDAAFLIENQQDVDNVTHKRHQELIFEDVGLEMIDSAFQGFNCTVLAYGQTGSGKTHTMVGDKTEKGKGLIPRVCEALFRGIEARRTRDGGANGGELLESDNETRRSMFSVHVSYMEIYKEKVNDLLDITAAKALQAATSPGGSRNGAEEEAAAARRQLKVREHPVTGPFVEGLSARAVTSYAEIADEMLAGDKLRSVASTLMNAVSSRSHAIFTITFTQTTYDLQAQCAHDKTSKICLIDLAGSERANASGTSGERLKEGAMINKSLTTLGRVIAALSKGSNERVPYRDSTLTWLLKESLGGNAMTTMLAMISPSADNYEETMSTLRYAESAKKVMNRAVVNEDKNAKIIRQLRQEIQDLRLELSKQQQLQQSQSQMERKPSDTSAGLSASLQEREEMFQQMQAELTNARRESEQWQRTAAAAAAASAANATSRVGGDQVQLHAELPSLVNMSSSLRANEALAYGLVEGRTFFGSAPPRRPEPLDEGGPGSPIADGGEKRSPIKRKNSAWGLLRRGSSSTLVGGSEPDLTANSSGNMSPLKRKKSTSRLTRKKSGLMSDEEAAAEAVALVSGGGGAASPPSSPTSTAKMWTQTFQLQASNSLREEENENEERDSHDMDICPQHIQIVCFRRARPPTTTGETGGDDTASDSEREQPSSSPPYRIELKVLDANALVKVNGRQLQYGQPRIRLKHGDRVQLGATHLLRVHVPQNATGNKENRSEWLVASENKLVDDEPAPDDEQRTLDELVYEANTLCQKLHIAMEFQLDGRLSTESVVVVMKHVEGDRLTRTIMQWGRLLLMRKLVLLRQVANAVDETTLSTTTIVADEAREQTIDTSRFDRTGTPTPPAPLSMPPVQEETEEVREPAITMAPRPLTPARSLRSLLEEYKPPTPPPMTDAPAPVSTTPCIRLLGQARVHVGSLDVNGGSPPPVESLSAAVFDASGKYIARLEVGLTFYVPTQQAARRTSLFGKKSREDALNVRMTMRQLEFAATAMTSQWISLTVKKWNAVQTGAASESDEPAVSVRSASTGPSPWAYSTRKLSSCGAALEEHNLPIDTQLDADPTRLFMIEEIVDVSIHDLLVRKSSAKRPGDQTAGLTELKDSERGFLTLEVWGYGDLILPPQNLPARSPIFAPAEALQPAPTTTTRLEFYVSVDAEEREADGLFRPVSVKRDGSLRVHASQPRRLHVRLTQADQLPFGLQYICAVALSAPFSTSSRSLAGLAQAADKCTQSLLLPTSPRGTPAPTWSELEMRNDCVVDPAARSLSVCLKWEPPAGSEQPDAPGFRSVFRVAIAFVTRLEPHNPVVISKSMVVKLCPPTVSSTQKLVRHREHARTAWWARESFSRNYRLGTWYSVELLAPIGGAKRDTSFTSNKSDQDNQIEQPQGGAAPDTLVYDDALVAKLLGDHVKGLERLEEACEIEEARQRMWLLFHARTASAAKSPPAEGAENEEEDPEANLLTLDRAKKLLEELHELGDEVEPLYEAVSVQRDQVFLRRLGRKDMMVAVSTGTVWDFSAKTAPPPPAYLGLPSALSQRFQQGTPAPMAHFVTEPTHFDNAGVGEMSGFLMFSQTYQVENAAAVQPLNAPTTVNKPTPSLKYDANQWGRRWFVLKRPFLYAYKTFACKEQVGVIDMSKCQLLVAPTATSSSGAEATSHVPFCFQLVGFAGTKCIVWSLQASTAAEMRAWLVAIDPLKIEARASVVQNVSADGVAITA
ncbi:TPA: hypothetical protein N0F65_001155 [Lagenidium giganteum]|uniref:Kinesin n=1 Tax=Lagenidium giganteum TaxID=4803 RepID=A0AAV2YYD9_9STRA|nr:TPA: hypothetical protein N0F65_001155 [Lagenidium giganteum]